MSQDGQKRLATEKYYFASFNMAFAFMARVALTVERDYPHLELFNRYLRVLVCWTSHSNVGVLALGLELAAN